MGSIPLLLEEAVLQARRIYKMQALSWREQKATDEDLEHFRREAADGTQFDPTGLKAGIWKGYQEGSIELHCKMCGIGRVVALLPKGVQIPVDSWGRVFQLFGKPVKGLHWTVYWFGAEAPRCFPKDGELLAAEHLNGGYTTICSTRGIFIYRLEEATRVLIHELLHAACLDPPGSLPEREATVESWAEVILVALRAKGSETKAAHLWRLQTQWVADTNKRAARAHRVKGQDDYAWRYMNGRADVYKSLGIALPEAVSKPVSSRFTHPELGD
jgi:hypothetical protein